MTNVDAARPALVRCIEALSTGTRLAARVRVPGSKSLTNRHLVLAALANGTSTLRGVLHSDDCDRLIAALGAMGAVFESVGDTLRVTGVGGQPRATHRVDLGDGGTPTRFMLAVAALSEEETEIDGSARMRERPIDEGVDMLCALGASARFPRAPRALPVVMRGPLRGGRLEVGRTASSQFVSALMLVAPSSELGIDLHFTDEPTSAAYLALSVEALASAGINVEVAYGPTPLGVSAPGAGLRRLTILPQPSRAYNVDIEPDASSAVYPAALAGLVGGRVELDGLSRRGAQPDAWFFSDLALRGAVVEELTRPDGSIATRVTCARPLRARDADYARAPDAAVIAMVLAACADGPSLFTGLETLRVKESDRIATVAAGLRALGGHVETGADWARIYPLPERLQPASIATANDHRIAMAFAVLGSARTGVSIEDPGVVSKSWPGFWDALDLLRRAVVPENDPS